MRCWLRTILCHLGQIRPLGSDTQSFKYWWHRLRNEQGAWTRPAFLRSSSGCHWTRAQLWAAGWSLLRQEPHCSQSLCKSSLLHSCTISYSMCLPCLHSDKSNQSYHWFPMMYYLLLLKNKSWSHMKCKIKTNILQGFRTKQVLRSIFPFILRKGCVNKVQERTRIFLWRGWHRPSPWPTVVGSGRWDYACF